MTVTVRSFAKINLGLCIGAKRADGFHELRTVYQTIGLHDVIRVSLGRGSGIEIHCKNPRVPIDNTNTCHRVMERAMSTLGAKGKVSIEIEKRLPVQGGLGGASSNAVATLLAVERALGKELCGVEKLRIASEVGSDLPLFLIGGTVLGVGRGEDVYPMPELSPTACVLATPEVGVSTPQAFADWDGGCGADIPARENGGANSVEGAELTLSSHSDRMNEFSRRLSSWLGGLPSKTGKPVTGVPAGGRGQAESLLLDLVRTGIENDFEQVVFPKHPELREVKRVLERAGAFYASLSGSGSALYGLFRTREGAEKGAARLRQLGIPAQATLTLNRRQYWQKIIDC
jgi:4-diphosphocytidyl-2-C-methyl-D-erythritol kinase